MELFFKQVEIGPMANYIYFLGDPQTKEMIVVDPAWDIQAIRNVAKEHDYQIKKVLITHGHPDHINAVEDLMNVENATVYMHQEEVPWISGWKDSAIHTQHLDEIPLGKHLIKCIHTPGHTEGSQCFLIKNQLLSGDTLFIDGCGRTDLPGGDAEKLYDTFTKVIKKLDEDTMIYPGHHYANDRCQSLKKQLQTNAFLRAHTKEEFLSMVRPGFKSL